MAAAARSSGAAGGVEATLDAIRAVYKRLDPAGVDRDLAESFQVAAGRLMDGGNVHILPRNPQARWDAIKNAVGDTALAKQINRRFAKEQLLGLYDYSGGIDTVFLSEGGTVQDLASVLAHEMAHQTQLLRLDLEGMETFEAEFQAMAAERAYMQLLAPEDVALLSQANREIRDAKDLSELENITRTLDPKKSSWLLPRHVLAGRTGVLQAMADEILAALRKR